MCILWCQGPEEDLPRDMAHFEFVCHAPSDYYKQGTQYKSYPVDSPLLGCVWTAFGPNIETVDSNDVVNGDRPTDGKYKSHHSATDDVQKCATDGEKRSTLFREKTRSHKAGLARSKDRLIK